MKKPNHYLTGGILILLGILFIVLRGSVISIAMTVIGAGLLVLGITSLLAGLAAVAIVELIGAAIIIVFGWTLVSFAIYVLAALLIVFGVMQIIDAASIAATHGFGALAATYARPILSIVAGICLFVNRGGILNSALLFAGILLLIEGVLELTAQHI